MTPDYDMGEEQEQAAEAEVEEQAFRHGREDEGAEDEKAEEENDSEVEEQHFNRG